jgi:hypothetical protein
MALYTATAAPSVATMFDDNLEFQVVIPTLGIPHPTGYPLFMLLAKLFTVLLPWRDAAGRANLVSALAAATAIAVFYLLAQALSRNRLAAVIVTVALAVSRAWWAQATLADVYTAHALLVVSLLYFLLRWEDALADGRAGADRWLAAAALMTGLGLVHHRMFVLVMPAALVFILLTDSGLWRQPRRWVWPAILVLLPLPLYLYLPLRGQVLTSLDGTYRPTLSGTLDWIMARSYNVFLTGNPFGYHRDAAFFAAQFRDQLGIAALLAAVVGIVTAWRTPTPGRWGIGPARYLLLMLATLTQVAFGVAYKVEDISSFLIPAFLWAALWAALGLAAVLFGADQWLSRRDAGSRRRWLAGAAIALALALLLEPALNSRRSWPEMDRSQAWGVYDYGQDLVTSVAPNGEVVGLLGETTLVRYFRDVLGQRLDVKVVPADDEAARFKAVEAAVQRGQPVYLTRDLPGAAQRFSLHAVGPLIAVSPKAQPATPLPGREIGAGIRLVKSSREIRQTHMGPAVRLLLTWTAGAPITHDLKVSARLIGRDGAVAKAVDQAPVHFAYPTQAWVPGEPIQDVYDLALPAGTQTDQFSILLILYEAANGNEVGRLTLE